VEQLGSHWTEFYGILYLRIFLNSVEKIHVNLKPGKNSGYVARGPMYICGNIPPNSSRSGKRFRKKRCKELKHAFSVQYIFFRAFWHLWDNEEETQKTLLGFQHHNDYANAPNIWLCLHCLSFWSCHQWICKVVWSNNCDILNTFMTWCWFMSVHYITINVLLFPLVHNFNTLETYKIV